MKETTFFRAKKRLGNGLNKPLSLLLSLLVLTSFTATVFSSTDYFTYDSNGNMIRDTSRGQCYEYNDAHRLKKVTDCGGNTLAEYWYDHTGRKIKAVEGDVTILYPFPDFEERVSGGVRNTSMYVRLNGEIVARIDIDPYGNNRTYYYHGDHLGSTSLVTNESGDVVENTGYLPYGGLKTGGEQSGTHLYTGKELNPSTGLYYYEHRDYDPGIPKFLEPDPVIQDPYDPQTLNRYSYVRNNPLKYVDSSGNVFYIPLVVVGYESVAAACVVGIGAVYFMAAAGPPIVDELSRVTNSALKAAAVAQTAQDVGDVLGSTGQGAAEYVATGQVSEETQNDISLNLFFLAMPYGDTFIKDIPGVKGVFKNADELRSALQKKHSNFLNGLDEVHKGYMQSGTDLAEMHRQEVTEYQKGLIKFIERLENKINYEKTPQWARDVLSEELEKFKALLKETETFVPKNG